jgi:hypothetical protein
VESGGEGHGFTPEKAMYGSHVEAILKKAPYIETFAMYQAFLQSNKSPVLYRVFPGGWGAHSFFPDSMCPLRVCAMHTPVQGKSRWGFLDPPPGGKTAFLADGI